MKILRQFARLLRIPGSTPLYEACQNGWHQVLPLFETGSYYVTLYDDLYDKLNKNEMKITEVTEIRTILGQMKECADLGYFCTDFLSQSVEGGRGCFWNRTGRP